jgi:PAS domain S-box-containing protein
MSTNTPIAKGHSGAGGCFSIIADRSLEAIAVLDTNGVVHYANAAWVRMHGYEHRSEVVGERISAFHNKEQMSGDVLPFLQEVGRRGQISGPVGHMHKSGMEIPTYTTMVALKDETGKMRGVIVFAIDISELEQLKEDIRNLKREADKRAEELALAAKSLEKQAREMEIVENLLGARGAELSSVNKQLWQYMSEREQIQEQCHVLRAELVEKEKQVSELTSRLQRQNAEQNRLEQQWKTQYSEMMSSIDRLSYEVREMKHNEVEFLEDIDLNAKPIGATGGVNRDQLKELSNMAKKFAGN